MKERFDIVGHRRFYFCASVAITAIGVIVYCLLGFNLGTDFTAGSELQLAINQPFHTASVVQVLASAGFHLQQTAVTVAGLQNQTAMIRFANVLSASQEASIIHASRTAWPRSTWQFATVDPVVAQETSREAIWAVVAASLGIGLYVTLRFEYRFAVAGIVALLHDALIVLSVFVVFRLQVNLTFVAAVLTIIGYSINDTIVIFDRIRENLKLVPPRSRTELHALVNRSLWQTMSRSINTVLTVLIAAVMLFVFGGESIHHFSLALLIGLISGAWSSIFIAAPLWAVGYGRAMKRRFDAAPG